MLYLGKRLGVESSLLPFGIGFDDVYCLFKKLASADVLILS